MGKIINVPLAVHRLDMADEALAEIFEASGALLAYIAERDTTCSVIALSQGMLSRIKALSNIASECICSEDDERRTDDEIRRELTGLPAAARSATTGASDADDSDSQLQGAIAFYEMLREMDAVPGVLRKGFASNEEDNSTEYGHGAAQDLFMRYASRCGVAITDEAMATGFFACLVRYLLTDLKGLSLGYGDSAEHDAREALAEVAEARMGTPLTYPDEAAAPTPTSTASTASDERETQVPAATEHPEQASTAGPASDDAIEVARFAIAGLRAWRLLLPTDLDYIDTQAASQPQLVLRAIINFLEGAFEGPGNDLPPRQAAALLETVEAELWKVGTFELKSVSVQWCTRVAGMASAILEASVQAEEAADVARNNTPVAKPEQAADPAR